MIAGEKATEDDPRREHDSARASEDAAAREAVHHLLAGDLAMATLMALRSDHHRVRAAVLLAQVFAPSS